MRYLFSGFIRQTGKRVDGHVEACEREEAYETLGDNGIITESLTPDPKPLTRAPELPAAPQFADALDSALDSSSSQVAFDALAQRYRGKKVWVIDRDKIRRRVTQVVDEVLTSSQTKTEENDKTRERVMSALQGLFNDNGNIATERNADSVAGMRMPGGRGGAPPEAESAGSVALRTTDALEDQIGRLGDIVRQAEGMIAAMSVALRSAGRGGGGRRMVPARDLGSAPQNEVLLEIFKSNLELRKAIEATPAPALSA